MAEVFEKKLIQATQAVEEQVCFSFQSSCQL